jgi:hypothetical protein
MQTKNELVVLRLRNFYLIVRIRYVPISRQENRIWRWVLIKVKTSKND